MKKVFFLAFILLMTLLTPEGLAEKYYPHAISNFQSYGEFENAYQKIYDDVRKEDDELVLARVAEHDFQKNFGHDFSPKEIVTLCALNVPGVYAAKKETVSQNYQIDTSIKIKKLCEEEREFLRFENDLERRTGTMSIFADEILSNSPFDLIDDWNQIDEILHGQFYKTAKPTFPNLAVKTLEDDFDSEKECWKDERKDSEISGCENSTVEEYDLTDGSLSGIFNNLEELPITKLLAHPLAAQKTTHYFFEIPCSSDGNCLPDDTGSLNATSPQISFPTADVPEVHKPEMGDMASPFGADKTKFLTMARCFALTDDKVTSAGMETSQTCAGMRDIDFAKTVWDYERNTDFEVFTDHEFRVFPELSRMTQVFDLFLSETKKFSEIMEELRPKPQLY